MLDFATRRLPPFHVKILGAQDGDIQRRPPGLRQCAGDGGSARRRRFRAPPPSPHHACSHVSVQPHLGAVFSPHRSGSRALLMRVSATRLRPVFGALEDAFGIIAWQIDALKGIETVKAVGFREHAASPDAGIAFTLARTQFGRTLILSDLYRCGPGSDLPFPGSSRGGVKEVLAGSLTIGVRGLNALVGSCERPHRDTLDLGSGAARRVLLDRLSDVFEPEPEQGLDRSRSARAYARGRVRFENVEPDTGGPGSPDSREHHVRGSPGHGQPSWGGAARERPRS